MTDEMSKGYEYLSKLFDDGIFTEIGAFADKAGAVAAHGTVNGVGVYA